MRLKAIIACCSLFLADNFDLVIAAHEISCNITANVLSLRFLLGLLLVVWYTVTKASPGFFLFGGLTSKKDSKPRDKALSSDTVGGG